MFFLGKRWAKFVLLIIAGLWAGLQQALGQTQEIFLKNEHLNIKAEQYYIKKIIDERVNRTMVASLADVGTSLNNKTKSNTADFAGGTQVALQQFVLYNNLNVKSGFPLIIRVKKFNATETTAANGSIQGKVILIMSFDVDKGDDEILHLSDYNGNAVYTRGIGPAQNMEPALRQVFENGLIYINNWMNQSISTNIKLARAVKVIFTDFSEKEEGDTIYYNPKRPLSWNDFQSRIQSNKFDAEVFPTIGYEERNEVIKGVVVITMAMKVSLPKSANWVKEGSRNSYALNHEQRHFDIAKIAALHFEQRIKAENLPVNNYDGFINEAYLDAYREMNNMQKKYDDETRHGSDELAQGQWNTFIDKELKKMILSP
ncbi:hypothetical protein JN11_00097 [Mucilaginibacter frigoritolerans]|jgi:hypothetical protein|uniref:DUF922 domain-containing protein n=1 Tax=Mucilaginibacter frigoritolerans TaxID=652788 RepID=A0A562UFM0_9SPHI|nr:hypothetical protein [Mucilaginibacter frigoritolerans]TWJ04389.1 hypothetical protein JN11_00097 [Mucilaginibacter frigoritolerans]